MSRSPIRCQHCGTPLAEKHRGGRIDVLVESISAGELHEGGVVLVCKVCGRERFISLRPPGTRAA